MNQMQMDLLKDAAQLCREVADIVHVHHPYYPGNNWMPNAVISWCLQAEKYLLESVPGIGMQRHLLGARHAIDQALWNGCEDQEIEKRINIRLSCARDKINAVMGISPGSSLTLGPLIVAEAEKYEALRIQLREQQHFTLEVMHGVYD